MTKIPSTEVASMLKREYKIKITARELGEYAESFGMHKEYKRETIGGFRVYYWSEEDIEKLKKELL